MLAPLVTFICNMPLKRKILFHQISLAFPYTFLQLSPKYLSEPMLLDDYLIFPAASPPGSICRLEPLISYLSAAPQAEPHADGFSSGSSAAPQAEPHAAGFSSGLSAAPQAEPHADAGVSSIFLLHPKRFESAIMISSIFLSVKRSFSFAISL